MNPKTSREQMEETLASSRRRMQEMSPAQARAYLKHIGFLDAQGNRSEQYQPLEEDHPAGRATRRRG